MVLNLVQCGSDQMDKGGMLKFIIATYADNAFVMHNSCVPRVLDPQKIALRIGEIGK